MRLPASWLRTLKLTAHLLVIVLGILFLLVHNLPAQSGPTPVQVTGTFLDQSGNPAISVTLRWQLNNCATGRPVIFGVGTVITSSKVMAIGSNGKVTDTLWPNDVIDCGGVTGQTRWSMTRILNNVPQGPPTCYNVLAATNLNLDTAPPCTSMTPATPPGTANDATFNNVNILGQILIPETSLSPRAMNGVVFPDQFPGVDLAAQINNALLSLGGTANAPIDRAVIVLTPGRSYVTSPITIPNSTTSPYVFSTTLQMLGASVTNTDPTHPLIHVLGQNSAGGQSGTQILGGSLYAASGTTAPIIQADSDIAIEIAQNKFNGGTVGLLLLNGAFQDGGGGYSEQHRIHDNEFSLQTVAGIEMSRSVGTDSMEYGAIDHSNHSGLICGAAAIQIDSGVTIQGGELSGKINTEQGGCTINNPIVAIRNNGAGVYRGTKGSWSGEDTAGAGAFYMFGGSTVTTLMDMATVVTGMSPNAPSANTNSHLTMPYSLIRTPFGVDNCSQFNDESGGGGYVLSRKSRLQICTAAVRYFLGAETDQDGNGSFDIYYFGGNSPEEATSLSSTFRAWPGLGVAIGPGFTRKGNLNSAGAACQDVAGCFDVNTALPAYFTVSNNGHVPTQALVSIDPVSNYNYLTMGYRRPSDGVYHQIGGIGTDFAANGGTDMFLYSQSVQARVLRFDADGTPHFLSSKSWSGTCASGHSLIVLDGVVTGCQ